MAGTWCDVEQMSQCFSDVWMFWHIRVKSSMLCISERLYTRIMNVHSLKTLYVFICYFVDPVILLMLEIIVVCCVYFPMCNTPL